MGKLCHFVTKLFTGEEMCITVSQHQEKVELCLTKKMKE